MKSNLRKASESKQFLLPEADWIFGDSNDPLSVWVKQQVATLVEKLCGVGPGQPTSLVSGLTIVVGTAGNNRLIAHANERGLIAISRLGRDDYIIKRTTMDGKPLLIITGDNERAAMYGVFAFFEKLGCRFLISGDVLPEMNPKMPIPALNLLAHTDNSWRGLLWGGFCFPTNSIMSIVDYEHLFDQMAKMRLNRMVYFHFENEPFIDYSYKGERKLVGDISNPDSGYISYGRNFAGSYLVKDIPVGREKFERRRIAPLEFQDVQSSDEALDMGKIFISRLIDLAKLRGITSWITFQPAFVSMNMTKYTRRMPRMHLHWSTHVSCTDPVADEINRNRVKSIMESYPNAEGYFIGIPEGFFNDPYPESQKLVEREWGNYKEALALQKKYWGKFWPSEKLQKDHIRADIGFVEIAKKTIDSAKEINPGVRLGITTICKAYLLTYLDKTLPKDMPFIDIESGSLWTLDGAPLHLFKDMKGRECAIIPRAVDDGSLAGLQFNLNLYEKDRFCKSTRENGTSGLIIQTTHVRGNEHNLKFLAEGLWNDELKPDEFYQDYAEALFGPTVASTVVEAYKILEKNEEFLGGRGQGNMPWNMVPLQISILRGFKGFSMPFYKAAIGRSQLDACREKSAKWRKSLEYLSSAQGLFEQALPQCKETGKDELQYLIDKTEAYALHLNTLILITKAYEQYVRAFDMLDNGLDTFKPLLSNSFALAQRAEEEAIRSAERFADCVRHTTDLGVLWGINKSMVVGTRVLRQSLSNIVAFYDGREYWGKVDWDLLFGECPFPTYDLEYPAPKVDNTDNHEPG